jgi:hypothetical protein
MGDGFESGQPIFRDGGAMLVVTNDDFGEHEGEV